MRFAIPLLLLVATLAGGCVSVYRQDTQQGNVVTQEMLDQLKPGMTRSQVRFVLGTPLITDSFHPDRWDYVYYFRQGGGADAEMRRLAVIFRGDALLRVEGDVASSPASATANGSSPAR